MPIISDLFEAINFLTIFKLKGKNAVAVKIENIHDSGVETGSGSVLYAAALKKSIKYFPLAGLSIGLTLAAVFYIFNRFLPVMPAVLISIFFLYAITGGLHFDGLSDTSDGFSAYLKSGDKTKFYKAMKDVNAGISGNISVIFYILLMWSLIGAFNSNFVFSPYAVFNYHAYDKNTDYIYLPLISFPVVGRYSIVLMSYFSKTPDNFKGIGAIFTEGTEGPSFIAASIFTFIIIMFLLGLAGIFSLLAAVLIILFIIFYFEKKFGGVNGDMLGFGVKVSEIVFIAALTGFHKILY